MLGLGTLIAPAPERGVEEAGNSKVSRVAPATPADAKALLTAAIRDDDPVIVLENLALYNTKGEVSDEEQIGEIGRANMTATRRLQLAAEDSATIALMLRRWRRGWEDPLASPSAAVSRVTGKVS